jgi:apolipoprotein N-acyltransferase
MAALPCLAVWFGSHQLDQSVSSSVPPTIRVGLVQVDPTYSDNRERLVSFTRQIEGAVDLVCWPESSIGTYADELPNFRNEDQRFAQSREPNLGLRPLRHPRTPLLACGKSYASGVSEEGPYHVTAFLIDKDENIVGRYHKRCLIPIGERVPLEGYFPFLRDWANLDEITEAGQEPTILSLGTGTRIGAMICYEDALPGSARELSQAGANVLVCLINGTAFEQPIALRQHQQLAVLRAVENRKPLVRCGSTGITSIISPSGKILQQLEPQMEGTLVAEVSLRERQTFYTQQGDLFAWVCVAATLGLIAFSGGNSGPARLRPNRLEKKEGAEPNSRVANSLADLELPLGREVEDDVICSESEKRYLSGRCS